MQYLYKKYNKNIIFIIFNNNCNLYFKYLDIDNNNLFIKLIVFLCYLAKTFNRYINKLIILLKSLIFKVKDNIIILKYIISCKIIYYYITFAIFYIIKIGQL